MILSKSQDLLPNREPYASTSRLHSKYQADMEKTTTERNRKTNVNKREEVASKNGKKRENNGNPWRSTETPPKNKAENTAEAPANVPDLNLARG
jgi:hypothetical protein